MLGKPFRTGKAPYRCCRYRRKRHGRSPRNLTALRRHVYKDLFSRVERLIGAEQGSEGLVFDLHLTINEISQKKRALDRAFKHVVGDSSAVTGADKAFRPDHDKDGIIGSKIRI